MRKKLCLLARCGGAISWSMDADSEPRVMRADFNFWIRYTWRLNSMGMYMHAVTQGKKVHLILNMSKRRDICVLWRRYATVIGSRIEGKWCHWLLRRANTISYERISYTALVRSFPYKELPLQLMSEYANMSIRTVFTRPYRSSGNYRVIER